MHSSNGSDRIALGRDVSASILDIPFGMPVNQSFSLYDSTPRDGLTDESALDVCRELGRRTRAGSSERKRPASARCNDRKRKCSLDQVARGTETEAALRQQLAEQAEVMEHMRERLHRAEAKTTAFATSETEYLADASMGQAVLSKLEL